MCDPFHGHLLEDISGPAGLQAIQDFDHVGDVIILQFRSQRRGIRHAI
jgi:hypothetical protein